jgi:hypothetical protein
MRLYPPAWAVGRQAINDCKIGEYTIPAGSTILMSQYLKIIPQFHLYTRYEEIKRDGNGE